MRKKIIGIMIMAAIALAAGWNINQSENEVGLSDLALSNVEALASSETPEEFEAATGCRAFWEDKSCDGTDGKTHSYAYRI